MLFPPATRLIKCDVQTDNGWKWWDFVDGGNGCFYGIPYRARRVVEFNVEDKSIREIGPDLGDQGGKFANGIKADNGSIYCMPEGGSYPLKIIPGEGQNAEVQIIREMQLPWGDWYAGALANDGCIYYFPNNRGRILKLNPNNGDSLSFVGEEFYRGFKAAVLGKDGYIYGIYGKGVVKFSPMDHSVSNTGREFDENKRFSWAEAVLAEDRTIYAASISGQILCIDTAQNDWKIIGNKIFNEAYESGWGNAVIGADKCIYFPPACHDRALRYNPTTQSISLIGESYGKGTGKWRGSVLASDGYIYCVPYVVNEILQIDSRHVNEKVIDVIDNIDKGRHFR